MVKHCIVSSIVIILAMTVQTAIGATEERQVTLSQAINIAMEETPYFSTIAHHLSGKG